jgi:hypothetical protein
MFRVCCSKAAEANSAACVLSQDVASCTDNAQWVPKHLAWAMPKAVPENPAALVWTGCLRNKAVRFAADQHAQIHWFSLFALAQQHPFFLAEPGRMSAPFVWQCIKGYNSFIRKGLNGAIFSAEPGNLANKHSYKHSGGMAFH